MPLGRGHGKSKVLQMGVSVDGIVAGGHKVAATQVVFSKTLQKAEWKESWIARGELAEEIARLKNEPGKEIMAHGGATVVHRRSCADAIRLNN